MTATFRDWHPFTVKSVQHRIHAFPYMGMGGAPAGAPAGGAGGAPGGFIKPRFGGAEAIEREPGVPPPA